MTIKRVSLKSKTSPRNKAKLPRDHSEDMIKDENDLNYRQRRFVSEYSTSLNGNAAAIKAGYSKKTARVTAAQLLAKPNIKAAVEKTQARRLTRADITAERVLTEIASVGFAELKPEDVKPGDKLSALNTLARHLGLLVDKREVTGSMSILNVSVSQADLESARQLVEGFRSEKLIEGETIKRTRTRRSDGGLPHRRLLLLIIGAAPHLRARWR